MGDVVRISDDIFGEAAISGIAAEFGVGTDHLPSREAMLAMTAGRVEPGHPDPVALLDEFDAGAHRRYAAHGLMAGNERQLRLGRPVAGRRMQIGVTDSARLAIDENLARTGRWDRPLLLRQRPAEVFDDGDLHFTGQMKLLFLTLNQSISLSFDIRGDFRP